jgi:hypothetical protein
MDRTARLARTLGLVTTLAILISGCTAAGPSMPASSDEPGSTSAPGRASSAPESSVTDTSRDAWLVVGQSGEPDLQVILASTREQLYRLPMGAPRDRWAQVIAPRRKAGATTVDEIVVQPDLPAWRTRSVDGAWRLPTIGRDVLPVGVSADGSTIVLVEDGAPAGTTTSRFAVLAANEPARIIELAGSFEFDALAPDGSILYVVEHLPAPPDGHYQVRAVDMATGLIRDTVIVDKRNVEEQMGGWPITQARHETGVVFSLYRGAEHPFIHALNTVEAWAVCIDLPADGSDDPDAALDWGIAQSGDGRSVFAVNATVGLAVAIDPGELSIRQTAAFLAPRAAAAVSLAKFGHQEGGAVGRRAVASPDGSTLYAAGASGIVRLETRQLTVTAQVLAGVAVDALALTPDGAILYALQADGRIVKLDATSGEILGQVPGQGFDRLVAVVPW